MAQLSDAVRFAWMVAANEAVRLRHNTIREAHVFIGICKVGSMSLDDAARQLGLNGNQVAGIKREIGGLVLQSGLAKRA